MTTSGHLFYLSHKIFHFVTRIFKRLLSSYFKVCSASLLILLRIYSFYLTLLLLLGQFLPNLFPACLPQHLLITTLFSRLLRVNFKFCMHISTEICLSVLIILHDCNPLSSSMLPPNVIPHPDLLFKAGHFHGVMFSFIHLLIFTQVHPFP